MEIKICSIPDILSKKKELYKLTKASGINVKDVHDEQATFPVDAFILYSEPDSKGNVRDVLAVVSGGVKLTTVSATFIESFLDIDALMSPDPYSIKVLHGTSKNGRDFVTCELDCD